jgi:rhamnosyltransferase
MKVNYDKIGRDEFSHSRVREKAGLKAKGDILVFVTQDVIIKDENWLQVLIEPIVRNMAEASFSRQICDNNSIEKYIRESNYPLVSRIVSKDDVERYGILSFFFSDVASSVRMDIFRELQAYDAKDLITNEDMYFAYKLINEGYRIKYSSESAVIHSHTFTFMQLLKRYFDTGVFLCQNSYFFEYKANESAIKLLKYVTKRAFEEKNYKVIFNIIPNFAARFIGNILGKNYKMLPKNMIYRFSSNTAYWKKNDYKMYTEVK